MAIVHTPPLSHSHLEKTEVLAHDLAHKARLCLQGPDNPKQQGSLTNAAIVVAASGRSLSIINNPKTTTRRNETSYFVLRARHPPSQMRGGGKACCRTTQKIISLIVGKNKNKINLNGDNAQYSDV